MHQRSTLVTLIAYLSVPLVAWASSGCGSDNANAATLTYSCSTRGPCPRDQTPSANDATSCEALGNDPTCGTEFRAYSACAFSAAKCTTEGVSDSTADSTSDECSSDYARYTTCLHNKMNDAG